MKKLEKIAQPMKSLLLSVIGAACFMLLMGCPFIAEVKYNNPVPAGEKMELSVTMASDDSYGSWFLMELLLPEGWTVENDSIYHNDGQNQFIINRYDDWELPYLAPEGYYWWTGMARDITIAADQIFEVDIPLLTGVQGGMFDLALYLSYDCSGVGPCRLDSEPSIKVETIDSFKQPLNIIGHQEDGKVVLNWSPPADAAGLTGYYVYEDDRSEPVSWFLNDTTFVFDQPQKGIHQYRVSSLVDNKEYKSNPARVFIGEEVWVSSLGSNENDGANRLEALQTLEYAMAMINPDSGNPVTIRMASDTISFAPQYGQELKIKDHVSFLGQGEQSVIDLKGSNYYGFKLDSVQNVFFEDLSIINSPGAVFYASNSKVEFKRVNFIDNYHIGELSNTQLIYYNSLFENSGLNSGYVADITFQNCVIIIEPNPDYYLRVYSGERHFINSIIWGSDDISSTHLQSNTDLTTQVEFSSVQGGHNNNPAILPEFDHSLQPYRLGENSLCIDAGNPDEAYFDAEGSGYQGTPINDLGIYGGPHARRSNLIMSTEEEITTPIALSNYPNPAVGATTIRYTLNRSEQVELALYSTDGREKHSLLKEFKNAGSHEFALNTAQLKSGIYLLQLTTADDQQIHRMMVR